jgi:hypothetical protein
MFDRERVFGIEVGYYEGGDYLVVLDDGKQVMTGSRPVFSPSGRHLASAYHDYAHGDGGSLRLWLRDEPHTPIRIVTTQALGAPAEVVWLSDTCLSFQAGPPEDLDDLSSPRRRTWYLKAGQPEWVLTSIRAPECR